MGYFKVSPEILEREDWLLARKYKLPKERMTPEAIAQLDSLPRNKKGEPIIMGGSDLGAALGVSKFKIKTARDLWLELAGEKEPEDLSNSPAIIRGNTWEKHIFEVLTEVDLANEYGKENIICGIDKHTYGIEGEPFVVNTDGWCKIKGKPWLVEIKTLGTYQREVQLDWLDGIVPETYEMQCRLYNHVFPQFKGVIICCAWGLENDQRTHIFIERDEKKEKELVDAALAFIKSVEEGNEPEEKKYVEAKLDLDENVAQKLELALIEHSEGKKIQKMAAEKLHQIAEEVCDIFNEGNKASVVLNGDDDIDVKVSLNQRANGTYYASTKIGDSPTISATIK